MRPQSYEEDYGPSPTYRRNGPASATGPMEGITEGAVTMAAASLTGPDVISEVAKKGIAELLMTESIKAKITEVCL